MADEERGVQLDGGLESGSPRVSGVFFARNLGVATTVVCLRLSECARRRIYFSQRVYERACVKEWEREQLLSPTDQ